LPPQFLPEWAKSRLKHIDFDVHFSPSEEARRTLNEIFTTPNDVFQWFAMFYLQELTSANDFSDDELAIARKCIVKLYAYAGLPLPCFFPTEPLEKRRLAPIPADWATAPEHEVRALLSAAKPVPPRQAPRY